jgi:hypothetical protein
MARVSCPLSSHAAGLLHADTSHVALLLKICLVINVYRLPGNCLESLSPHLLYDESCCPELAVSCGHLQHPSFLQGHCPMPLVVGVLIVIYSGVLLSLIMMKNHPPL